MGGLEIDLDFQRSIIWRQNTIIVLSGLGIDVHCFVLQLHIRCFCFRLLGINSHCNYRELAAFAQQSSQAAATAELSPTAFAQQSHQEAATAEEKPVQRKHQSGAEQLESRHITQGQGRQQLRQLQRKQRKGKEGNN